MAKKQIIKSTEVGPKILNAGDIERSKHLIPPNDHIKPYSIGDKVRISRQMETEYGIINNVYDDGKYYDVVCHKINHKTENRYTEERRISWMDIYDFDTLCDSNFSKRYDELKINYSNRELNGLIVYAHHFGIDFDPFYQRGYVWSMDDKIALIDSIFNAADIGKFVFAQTGKYYPYLEIIDGKQRLRTVLDFYERRFQYNGYYFHELSHHDQRCFIRHQITYAEIGEGATDKQKLAYFISLNITGHDVGIDHIERMKKKLESM